MDFKKLTVDPAKAQRGRWFPVGGGARVSVAAMNNPAFKSKIVPLQRPHLKRIRRNTLSETVAVAILSEAMAGTVLLGWEGFTDDGKEVVFSESEAQKRLQEHEGFRDLVSEFAMNLEAELQEEMVEGDENLGKSSNGNSPSESTPKP